MKLRGRPEAPDQAPRAHTVFSARGADMQAGHGPLQRLLEDASSEAGEQRLPAKSIEGSSARDSKFFMPFKTTSRCVL